MNVGGVCVDSLLQPATSAILFQERFKREDSNREVMMSAVAFDSAGNPLRKLTLLSSQQFPGNRWQGGYGIRIKEIHGDGLFNSLSGAENILLFPKFTEGRVNGVEYLSIYPVAIGMSRGVAWRSLEMYDVGIVGVDEDEATESLRDYLSKLLGTDVREFPAYVKSPPKTRVKAKIKDLDYACEIVKTLEIQREKLQLV